MTWKYGFYQIEIKLKIKNGKCFQFCAIYGNVPSE